jgi:hypothetical protein
MAPIGLNNNLLVKWFRHNHFYMNNELVDLTIKFDKCFHIFGHLTSTSKGNLC